MMVYNIDSELENADWTKASWDLPPYRSEEFMGWLVESALTLTEFKKLPVYRLAVKRGLIKNDKWVVDLYGGNGNTFK